jgi:LysM repeat protein
MFDPGLVLKIPQSSKPFPAARALKAHPTTYTVGGDETIYSIACKFGDVDPMAIAAANGLTAPYTLKLGQVLNIP